MGTSARILVYLAGRPVIGSCLVQRAVLKWDAHLPLHGTNPGPLDVPLGGKLEIIARFKDTAVKIVLPA